MQDLHVLDSPDQAAAALEPTRARLLAALSTPGSSSTLADLLGMPRQRVNYHLRALESAGLVALTEERQRRGFTERLFQATASAYVVSPAALGRAGADPQRIDRLSTRYLIALAARMIQELGQLTARADAAGKYLPTLTIDTEIRFGSAADRAAFTRELGEAVTGLAARYHDQDAPDGRWHRLVVAAHPRPQQPSPTSPDATTDPDTTLE